MKRTHRQSGTGSDLCARSIFCSDESGFWGECRAGLPSVSELTGPLRGGEALTHIAAVVRALAVALSGLSLWPAPGGRSSDGPDVPFREADEQ